MPLSAIDAASLATPLGVAIYLALIAGLRGEQIVFILFLGGRKVGTFPKTQARNTVSGGRRAERPISDSCFRKEILPLPSQVLRVAPKQTQGIHVLHGLCSVLCTVRAWGRSGHILFNKAVGLICLHPGLDCTCGNTAKHASHTSGPWLPVSGT